MNLCDPGAIGRWLMLIAIGVVVGAVGGPPCETWSQVRNMAGGPPVVRTAAAPWGVAGLRPKHLQQLRVATLLLQAFLLVFAALLRSGGVAMLEHPVEPEEAGRCSIWRLPVVRAICTHPDVRRIRVRQGPLGQPSAKPTHLMALRLPTLAQRLQDEADPQWRPAMVAVGQDERGEWRTAALKEYPPRMCRGIAWAVRDALRSAEEAGPAGREEVAAAAGLHDLVVPLVEGSVGADFAEGAEEALPPGPVRWEALAEAGRVEAVSLRTVTVGAPMRRRKRRGSADRPE